MVRSRVRMAWSLQRLGRREAIFHFWSLLVGGTAGYHLLKRQELHSSFKKTELIVHLWTFKGFSFNLSFQKSKPIGRSLILISGAAPPPPSLALPPPSLTPQACAALPPASLALPPASLVFHLLPLLFHLLPLLLKLNLNQKLFKFSSTSLSFQKIEI